MNSLSLASSFGEQAVVKERVCLSAGGDGAHGRIAAVLRSMTACSYPGRFAVAHHHGAHMRIFDGVVSMPVLAQAAPAAARRHGTPDPPAPSAVDACAKVMAWNDRPQAHSEMWGHAEQHSEGTDRWTLVAFRVWALSGRCVISVSWCLAVGSGDACEAQGCGFAGMDDEGGAGIGAQQCVSLLGPGRHVSRRNL
jgi:hypothetical protein